MRLLSLRLLALKSRVYRRTFVLTAGGIGIGGLAGCLGDDDDEVDDDAVDDDDDEIVEDDTADVDNDDAPADEPDDDTDDTEPTDDSADDDDEDNPRLRDVINWEESFAANFEFDDVTGSWLVYGDDSYLEWTAEGETIETYRIEDESYVVMNEQCFVQTIETPEDDLFDPEEPAEDDEEYVATGTDTIDGEDVWEFDVEGGTLAVSIETGYPVQFDADDGIVTFHSWGEVDPISPPDMECVEPDGDSFGDD